MSSYIDFYIRSNDDFISIADYSRSTELYGIMQAYAPYEKIKAISLTDFNKFKEDIADRIADFEKSISKCEDKIVKICAFSNSVDEKIEAIHEEQSYIDDCKETIEELKMAKNFLLFLEGIIENNRFEDDVNENELIYFGEEIGRPTVKDILENNKG